MPECSKGLYVLVRRLHREVEAFVNYISPTPVEDEIRGLVVDLVSKAVTQSFPDAIIQPFGSFGTKLYLPLGCAPHSSDIQCDSHSRCIIL